MIFTSYDIIFLKILFTHNVIIYSLYMCNYQKIIYRVYIYIYMIYNNINILYIYYHVTQIDCLFINVAFASWYIFFFIFYFFNFFDYFHKRYSTAVPYFVALQLLYQSDYRNKYKHYCIESTWLWWSWKRNAFFCLFWV